MFHHISSKCFHPRSSALYRPNQAAKPGNFCSDQMCSFNFCELVIFYKNYFQNFLFLHFIFTFIFWFFFVINVQLGFFFSMVVLFYRNVMFNISGPNKHQKVTVVSIELVSDFIKCLIFAVRESQPVEVYLDITLHYRIILQLASCHGPALLQCSIVPECRSISTTGGEAACLMTG